MRTRTIMRAFMEAAARANSDHHDWDDTELRGSNRRYEQAEVFRVELIRRMDERDALVAQHPPAFASVERIGQYMAGLSDGIKADNIFGAYPPKETPDWRR